MSILFSCHQCGAPVKAEDFHGVSEMPCPHCGVTLRAPWGEAGLAPPDDPLDETESSSLSDTLVSPNPVRPRNQKSATPSPRGENRPRPAATASTEPQQSPANRDLPKQQHEHSFPQLAAPFSEKLKHGLQWGVVALLVGLMFYLSSWLMTALFGALAGAAG